MEPRTYIGFVISTLGLCRQKEPSFPEMAREFNPVGSNNNDRIKWYLCQVLATSAATRFRANEPMVPNEPGNPSRSYDDSVIDRRIFPILPFSYYSPKQEYGRQSIMKCYA